MPVKKKVDITDEVIEVGETVESPKEDVEEKPSVKYPKIRGGICDFCGVDVKLCKHYKELFNSGKFRCLCGLSSNPSSFGQSIYMHAGDKIGFICNSEGCKNIVNSMGLFGRKDIFNFFNP